MSTETVPAGHEPPARLLGVCAAIGADFGFNPLWLRIGFAVALLFNLEIVLATYAGLGVLALASRLIFPDHKAIAAATPEPAVLDTREAATMDYRQAA